MCSKLLTAMVVVVGMSVFAEAGVDVGADIVSQYYWRGAPMGKDSDGSTSIAPALQPSVTASLPMKMSLNVWGSWILSDRDINDAVDEIDITLNYSRDLNDNLAMTFGGIYYLMPNGTDADVIDVYGGVSTEVSDIDVGVTAYYQMWMQGSGDASLYYVLSASKSLPMDLTCGLAVGGGTEAYESLHHIDISVGHGGFKAGPVSIAPAILLSLPQAEGAETVEYAVTVSLGWSP